MRLKNKNANLNISIDNGEHAKYFLEEKRSGAYIIEFDIPKWLDDLVKESAIPQYEYKSNPYNQGGLAPKVTDAGTPGTSIEFPPPWIDWIEEHAKNATIIKGN